MTEACLVLAFFAVGVGCFVLGGYIIWTQAKRIARLEAKLEMAKDYMTDLIVTD